MGHFKNLPDSLNCQPHHSGARDPKCFHLITYISAQFYSPPQSLEGNKSLVFVDGSIYDVDAVAHRNFYSKVEHSNLCQIAVFLIDIAFVLINMPLQAEKYFFSRQKDLTVSRQ